MRWSFLGLAFLVAWAPTAFASGPGDGLLRLAPPDSGLTLAVEDLRGHSREIGGSVLYKGIGELPAVRSWLSSDPYRKFERSSRELRSALGVSLETIRDDILGDAVILALHPGPADHPDRSYGLLLVQPRQKTLIPPLIKGLNEVQSRSGELLAVEPRSRGALQYQVRKFRQGVRPPEFYALLDDGSFAWSNSEALIQGVIDRRLAPGGGLGDDPDFAKVRRGLPERSFVSLFVNPRLLVRPGESTGDWPTALIARYLGSIRRAGFAFEWRDGIHLHSHEVLDPGKLDPWLKRWLVRPSSPVTLPSEVPASTIAVVSANVDPESLREAAEALIPESERPVLDNLKVVLQGILLGQDPLTEILPRLGPGLLLYVESEPDRAASRRFPVVGVLALSDRSGSGDPVAPLDNALRTGLAFYAFDSKRRAEHLRVESRDVGGARLTLLTDGIKAQLAYRAERNRLVVGNSPEAVARFGSGKGTSNFPALRSKLFPEAETFAIVDLRRLEAEVSDNRGPIAGALAARSQRPVEEVDRDLGQVLGLAGLFETAAFSSTSARDASEVHRTFSLIAR